MVVLAASSKTGDVTEKAGSREPLPARLRRDESCFGWLVTIGPLMSDRRGRSTVRCLLDDLGVDLSGLDVDLGDLDHHFSRSCGASRRCRRRARSASRRLIIHSCTGSACPPSVARHGLTIPTKSCGCARRTGARTTQTKMPMPTSRNCTPPARCFPMTTIVSAIVRRARSDCSGL